MKISKLLVLSALCLTATSAMAEIVDGVRQRPAVTQFETFQADEVFYLYNVQARRFFVGANDWGTRASIAPNGYKVKFVDQGDAAPMQGVLEFTDSVETKKAWLGTFSTNDGGAIWVDNSGETYRFWSVEPVGGAYRISNPLLVEAGVEAAIGTYLGWNGSEGDTRLYFCATGGIDWQFVSEANYNAYQETWAGMKDQFEKAAELKTYLESAKEQGIDVSTWENVYLNEAATVEELEAAILAVQKAIADAVAAGASVQNPKDMTGSILNPTFENASYDGWKGTAPNMVGNGSHGPANVAEHYNKTFDTYQDLNGMPKGVYMLQATAAFRTTWEDHVNHTNYIAYLYGKADGDTLTAEIPNFWDAMNTEPMAGSTEFGTTAAEESRDEDGVTYYIPNDPSAGRLYFEKGYYKTNVFFAVEGDDPIRLGVMKQKNVTGTDWVIFDNFALTYYGNAPESFQFWLDKTKESKADYSEAVVSKMYLEAYDAAFEVTVTNKAEAVAAMKNIKAASDSILKNSNLWAELAAKFEDAQQYTVGQYGPMEAAGPLGDYLAYVVEDEMLSPEEKTQSNAELEAAIAMIDKLIKDVVDEYKNQLEPYTDVTEYITNPDFEEGKDSSGNPKGWTVVSKGGGNVQLGGNSANHCFEAWHSTNFEVYQNIENLPLGVYEIEVQGYVRYLDGQDAINNKDNSESIFAAGVPIYVYMNDSKTNFVNWFSYPKPEEFYTAVTGATYLTDGDGFCYPDNMTAAAAAFADGGYKQSAKGLVANKGDVLRVGVKGTPEAKFWPIFDNFKLTYLGYQADVVKPVLEAKLAEVAESKIQEQWLTKEAKTALDAAVGAANASLSETDGVVMFNALSALTKAVSEAEDANVLCKALYAKAEDMMAIAQESNSIYAADALTLGGEIMSKIETSEIEEAEIEPYELQIKEMLLKMNLPADYQEGSAEGTDVTAFIQTPSFQKGTEDTGYTNSIDGWEGTAGYNFGNDETQRGALALEFYEKVFDMYQDVQGIGSVVLPDGNYMVTVNAFERVSDNTPAYLYAESGDNKVEVELMKHADGVNTDEGESAPGDMVSAAAYFEEGRYLNSVSLPVTGGKLRIGIKHESSTGADWIIMDNFKLFFFGADETAVKSVSASNKVVSVEYFTIDGRRVSAAQKGITIRKAVMEDGTVVVRKMRK